MANYVISSGTYTNFNFRTLSNIILTGQIVVVGNFEIRSAGYIDCSQAVISSTGSGSIVLRASGVHPTYPGYPLTLNSVYYPNAFGAAILLGSIIASQCSVNLLAGMTDPDEPGAILNTAAFGPNGTTPQLTAASLRMNSTGIRNMTSGYTGIPTAAASEVSFSSISGTFSRGLITQGAYYRLAVDGYFGSVTLITTNPNRLLQSRYGFTAAQSLTPWNGSHESLPEYTLGEDIKLSDIAAYFGDTGTNRIQEFYSGGNLVPIRTPRAPSSGFGGQSGIMQTGLKHYVSPSPYAGTIQIVVNGQVVTSSVLSGGASIPSEISYGGSIYYITTAEYFDLSDTENYILYGIAIARRINTNVPASGEIRISNFFEAKRWSTNYTTYTAPGPANYVIWFPEGDTSAGPQPGPQIRLFLEDIAVYTNTYYGQFGMSMPSTISYSGTTYNIDPNAYSQEMFEYGGVYKSYHNVSIA